VRGLKQPRGDIFYTPELLGYTENIFLPMLVKEKGLPSSGLWCGVMEFSRLLEKAREYLPPEKLTVVEEAYKFAAEKHEGQVRLSGDPYLEHPLQTAYILAGLQLDASSLAAALLHDIPEDTGLTVADIEKKFGPEIAKLVDGTTKLGKVSLVTSGAVTSESQAENLRKMLVAMAEDLRVVFIKPIELLRKEFDGVGLVADISGRPKHIYSIHQKMERYASMGRHFDEIHDLLALRVLVGSMPDCYSAVGVIHSLWHPLPDAFDDYIASPKPNDYQALHTAVMALGTTPLEIQIRTREMHHIAEYGVAAHWRYKEGEKRDMQFEDRVAWLRQLIEWHRELSGAEEFLESVKTDIFIDQVFVYTPKGEIKDLPRGATLAELFAYSSLDDFLAAVGNGSITAHQIVLSLAAQEEKEIQVTEVAPSQTATGTVQVLGVGDLVTNIAPCCHPVPGDKIIGYITRSRGVTIHREDCRNIHHEDEKERLIPVEWGHSDVLYPVNVQVEAWDRVGLMRDVTTVVAEDKVNIASANLADGDGHTITLYLTLER